MEEQVFREIISVIRAERDSRWNRLKNRRKEIDPDDRDSLDYLWDFWNFEEEPFLNNFCLMLLVAIRHKVERGLIRLAARVTHDGRELGRDEYYGLLKEMRDELRRRGYWKELEQQLRLEDVIEWDSSMDVLRLLVNSYKHNQAGEPDEDLLKKLQLPLDQSYAPLAESSALKEGLVACLGLKEDADYCDIADEMLTRSVRFLEEVETNPSLKLSKVKIEPMSLNPKDFAH